jgi:hypothetical protein
VVDFTCARAPKLGPWLDLVVVRGEVVMQFWLKPGEAAVALGVREGAKGGTDTGAIEEVFGREQGTVVSKVR